MDLSVETRRKLRDMGASDLLGALEAQDEGMCMGMTCAERVQMAVDEAHSSFVTSKVRNLTKRAGLRYPGADVRSIDFSEERGLDRLLVTELSTCGFAERGQNVVLQGPTGTGKTYLACALAKAACQRRMRAWVPSRILRTFRQPLGPPSGAATPPAASRLGSASSPTRSPRRT